jgi:hypothetical protein
VLTLGRGIFPVNFRISWLLSNLDMRFNCAGSHKVGVHVLGRGIFLVNFCINWLLSNLDMRFDCAGSHKMVSALWAHYLDMAFDCAGSRKVYVRVLGPTWAAALFL